MVKNKVIFHTIVSPLFAENTYIAHLEGQSPCIVVDPGLNPDEILDVIRRHDLQPQVILNTHGHADHIAGNGALKKAYPHSPLVIGAGDAYKLTDPVANLSAGFQVRLISPEADLLVNEPQTHSWAGLDLEVLDTPGHSAGHVVFLCKSQSPWIVFGGDVLFQGSIGRADFPDGDFETLRRSIQDKIFTLPEDTLVLPGHGPPTTVGEERRTNPFVGEPARRI